MFCFFEDWGKLFCKKKEEKKVKDRKYRQKAGRREGNGRKEERWERETWNENNYERKKRGKIEERKREVGKGWRIIVRKWKNEANKVRKLKKTDENKQEEKKIKQEGVKKIRAN